jgi:Ca2+/H+ antiporter
MFARGAGWGDGWVFTLALVAICPLAERLGFVTEQLAAGAYTRPLLSPT